MSVVKIYSCTNLFQDYEICPCCEGCILVDVNTTSFYSDEPMKKVQSLVTNIQRKKKKKGA